MRVFFLILQGQDRVRLYIFEFSILLRQEFFQSYLGDFDIVVVFMRLVINKIKEGNIFDKEILLCFYQVIKCDQWFGNSDDVMELQCNGCYVTGRVYYFINFVLVLLVVLVIYGLFIIYIGYFSLRICYFFLYKVFIYG